MGKATYGWPTLLTMARGGQSLSCTTCDMHFESKMASIVRPLGRGIKSYTHCNKLNGVMLVHIHYIQYAWNPTNVVSTKIGLPNHTWIWCHTIKFCNFESFNGGTFPKRYMNGWSWVPNICNNVHNNSLKNLNLGSNKHMYLLKNGLDMVIQLSPYPLGQHHLNLTPLAM
jgi:hypothetical protein